MLGGKYMSYMQNRGGKKSRIIGFLLLIFICMFIGGLLAGSVFTGAPFWDVRSIMTGLSQEFISEETEALEAPPVLASVEDVIISVVDKAGPAVCMITTTRERAINIIFQTVIREEQGLGSGVLYDSEGYILTNNHVIEGAVNIDVILPDGREFKDVKVIGVDFYTDLAVLKIEGYDLPVIEIGNSDKIRTGQLAIAIGNPYGLDYTVTSGIISALDRPLTIDQERGVILKGLIQTDAPINPGNSGGPLLNSAGQVIGINTAILGEAQSIGFSIPINEAMKVADEIQRHGRVRRPWVGFLGTELTKETIEKQNLPIEGGIRVDDVLRKSPAYNAGIRKTDIIIAIGGDALTTIEQLRQVMEASNIGDTLKITVLRDGRTINIPVIVEEMPQDIR